MKRSHQLCAAAFALLLALPLLQKSLHILPRAKLGGVETPQEWPRWTLRGWLDGSLQPAFEQAFNQRLATRPHLIKSWNQLHYTLFGFLPSRPDGESIVIGRDRYLYEQPYLRVYNRPGRARRTALRPLAARLRQLQDALHARGHGFLLVIAPSKVEIYPEFVPPHQLAPDRAARQTDYDRLLPLLREAGVHLLDGHADFLAAKAEAPHPLFSRTGTHWNYYGAGRVVARMLQIIEQQTGRNLPDLVMGPVREDRTPAGTDDDLLELLNTWGWPSLWDRQSFAVPQLHPSFRLTPDPAARPARLLLVGDSFVLTLAEVLETSRACAQLDVLYYFNRTITYPATDRRGTPLDRATFDLASALAGRDAVVIEISEHRMAEVGYGFVEAALRQLAAPAAGSLQPATPPP